MSEALGSDTDLAADDERDEEVVTTTDASRQRGRTLCEGVAVTLEPCGFCCQEPKSYETRSRGSVGGEPQGGRVVATPLEDTSDAMRQG